jgi:hypothetical protein
LILQSGINDSGLEYDSNEWKAAFDKSIAQGLKYFPRVVYTDGPPRARADLTNWDSAEDDYANLGHKTRFNELIAKWAGRYYAMWADFDALKTAATYTVAQLMRDAYHPTTTTGSTRISTQLLAQLNNSTAATLASPTISGEVINYIYGVQTVGTWSLVSTVNAVGPTAGPLPRIAGLADQALEISQNGAKLTFPSAKFKQCWVHYCLTTGGGNFRAYVDRNTVNEKSSTVINTNDVYDKYPRCTFVGTGLNQDIEHTVEIETTNGSPVKIIGVTYVGVQS